MVRVENLSDSNRHGSIRDEGSGRTWSTREVCLVGSRHRR